MSSPRQRGCFPNLPGHPLRNLVFPAPAGVFPISAIFFTAKYGLPRASGGVSGYRGAFEVRNGSSPRQRGCFYADRQLQGQQHVFPAPAGVFHPVNFGKNVHDSLPRASGGVSQFGGIDFHFRLSSPRQRGCFPRVWNIFRPGCVFPAPAGVFLDGDVVTLDNDGLPRASGGVSNSIDLIFTDPPSSPRQRGCFWLPDACAQIPQVFPAPAGVFPSYISWHAP